MEIFPDVHRIETIVGGRRLFQFFLMADRAVLVDAGEKETPEQSIYPYLEAIGQTPESIEIVIVTHADTDHHGGLATVKHHSPRSLITCGRRDRRLIENPEHLFAVRYRAYEKEHGIGYPEESITNASAAVDPTSVDVTWVGGESLTIAPGWELEIVPTPGHTRGHIAIHDLRHNALYCGDAVHGSFYPTVQDKPALPPNYVNVSDYLGTVSRLERLGVQSLHGAHWPARHGSEEVDRFLAESRDALEHLERVIVEALAPSSEVALSDVIDHVRRAFPDWKRSRAIDLAYAVEAHLARLVASGQAQSRIRNRTRVYLRAAAK